MQRPRFVPLPNRTLKHRLQGAISGAAAPILALVVVTGVTTPIRPAWAEGATLWVSQPGLSMAWLFAGMIALPVFALPVFALFVPAPFRDLRRWLAIIVGLIGVALLLDAGVSGRPAVAYWPDRIERRERSEPEHWRADAVRVETACEFWRGRHFGRRPAKVVIEVVLPDSSRLDLTAARPPAFSRGWEERVDRLLVAWEAAGVERRVRRDDLGRKQDNPYCIARLWDQQDETAFAHTARWLNLNEQALQTARRLRD